MDTSTATRQVWKHQASGDLYAIELEGGDELNVQRAFGPLDEGQARQIAQGTPPDTLGVIEATEFVQGKTGEFEPVEPG